MKKAKYVLLLLFILITIWIGIKTLIPNGKPYSIESVHENTHGSETVKQKEVNKPISKYNISQISMSKWNTPKGITYSQVPGANLGATSFQIIDKNHIAFLCNSTDEIVITDKSSGESTKRFQVSFAPRDFIYENGIFYVLSEYEVTEYDENGNVIKKCPFPNSYQGVERLMRNNDATYLLLPSGNSLMIENCGTPIEPVEYDGIITGIGQFIKTQITGNNSYSIKITFSKNQTFEKTFTTEKKVAGVFVVGAADNRIVLDVQTFISENPIAVERTITSIELNKNELGAIMTSTIVPDSYYVISNKDFYVSETGIIYNMMTSPQGVYVFLLSDSGSKSEKAKGYPSSLTDTQYHSNDHLIKID